MARHSRKIVRIDPEKCDGCGLCAPDCAEGAIQVIDGKARLVAENLCDGLGNCLGACPNGAIIIEERPAEEFDEAAVRAHLQEQADRDGVNQGKSKPAEGPEKLPCGCPGTMTQKLNPGEAAAGPPQSGACEAASRPSRLGSWPVQLALLPAGGDIWKDANVLIAADCVGFAMPDFHERLLAGRTLMIACPKLDETGPYVQKLASIFANSRIKSITVARMEVPCCGLDDVVHAALEKSGATIPLNVMVVSTGGRIVTANGVSVA